MAGESILVVDDDQDNLDVTCMALTSECYHVRPVRTGYEALAALREHRPALILLDIQLPGMDGLETTRKLRSDPANRDIPILAYTAYAMAGDEDRALDAGCDAYIAKPASIAELLDVVARCLAK
ncbi:MAG: response regulator [Actinomycetota bacterium]